MFPLSFVGLLFLFILCVSITSAFWGFCCYQGFWMSKYDMAKKQFETVECMFETIVWQQHEHSWGRIFFQYYQGKMYCRPVDFGDGSCQSRCVVVAWCSKCETKSSLLFTRVQRCICACPINSALGHEWLILVYSDQCFHFVRVCGLKRTPHTTAYSLPPVLNEASPFGPNVWIRPGLVFIHQCVWEATMALPLSKKISSFHLIYQREIWKKKFDTKSVPRLDLPRGGICDVSMQKLGNKTRKQLSKIWHLDMITNFRVEKI